MSKQRSRVAAVLAMVVFAGFLACGPFFPNRFLQQGDKTVLEMPSLTFRSALQVVRPKRSGEAVKLEAPSYTVSTLSHDDGTAKARERASATPHLMQFELYENGREMYLRNEWLAAREAFEQLLALPEAERRDRSVWAAYMLGRISHGSAPADAARWYRTTRELAAGGYTDELGLATASIGWEAQLAYRQRQFLRAINLYTEQLVAGDDTADESLSMVLAAMSEKDAVSDDDLDRIARDRNGCAIVTAWVATNAWRSRYGEDSRLGPRFIDAIVRNGVEGVVYAELIAWISYQNGRFDLAERWIKAADPASPNAMWVRAKLLLRAGQIEAATQLMRAHVAAIAADDATRILLPWGWAELSGPPETWGDARIDIARGELGRLLLATQRYQDALDMMLAAGLWQDAAYIAERVLTIDELAAYIARGFVAKASDEEDVPASTLLANLFARRLMRAGRYDDAIAAFAPDAVGIDTKETLRDLARQLQSSIAFGRDPTQAAGKRADALWRAACIARKHGLELLGTEGGPDFAVWDGHFEQSESPFGPVEHLYDKNYNEQPGPVELPQQLVPPSADELARYTASACDPMVRFHYRFLAADLGWEAAALMPDGTDATAKVLCQAGSWIKLSSPQRADRFYKALVRRCGKTALGIEAARLRWFPKVDAIMHDDKADTDFEGE